MDQPYDFREIKTSVYGHRRPVIGEIVALLHISFKDRGLELIETKSRALNIGEIHELMLTDENDAAPGGRADRVSAIAFFEVKQGGLAVFGDRVTIGGCNIGEVAGYDLTHMPNHMNVLVKSEDLDHPDLHVGDRLVIVRSL
ncbi:MAG: DUF6917 domain-containing protein [Candidatus Bathyarchaeia archaeon]